ncbi:hypothetical protein L6452_22184 [Arctium lappa]|uniref:Uncharacterized protein n=1 Tax=Arctium lappa TaxID=4217 RepID=A0ACB9AZD6_ARCLA|nr:hypothetical protein L6452_22184 [Arctium lappa]
MASPSSSSKNSNGSKKSNTSHHSMAQKDDSDSVGQEHVLKTRMLSFTRHDSHLTQMNNKPNNHFVTLNPSGFPTEAAPLIQFWLNARHAKMDKYGHYIIGYATHPSTEKILDLGINHRKLSDVFEIPTKSDLNLRKFSKERTKEEILEFLMFIGYAVPITKRTNFRRQNLPPLWNVLFSILNRCLTSKVGSPDQSSHTILAIMYGIYYDLPLDYAGLIFSEIQNVVISKQQDQDRGTEPKNMAFGRFLGLLLGDDLIREGKLPAEGKPIKLHEMMSHKPTTIKTGYPSARPLSTRMLIYLGSEEGTRIYIRGYRTPEPSPATPPRVGFQIRDVAIYLRDEGEKVTEVEVAEAQVSERERPPVRGEGSEKKKKKKSKKKRTEDVEKDKLYLENKTLTSEHTSIKKGFKEKISNLDKALKEKVKELKKCESDHLNAISLKNFFQKEREALHRDLFDRDLKIKKYQDAQKITEKVNTQIGRRGIGFDDVDPYTGNKRNKSFVNIFCVGKSLKPSLPNLLSTFKRRKTSEEPHLRNPLLMVDTWYENNNLPSSLSSKRNSIPKKYLSQKQIRIFRFAHPETQTQMDFVCMMTPEKEFVPKITPCFTKEINTSKDTNGQSKTHTGGQDLIHRDFLDSDSESESKSSVEDETRSVKLEIVPCGPEKNRLTYGILNRTGLPKRKTTGIPICSDFLDMCLQAKTSLELEKAKKDKISHVSKTPKPLKPFQEKLTWQQKGKWPKIDNLNASAAVKARKEDQRRVQSKSHSRGVSEKTQPRLDKAFCKKKPKSKMGCSKVCSVPSFDNFNETFKKLASNVHYYKCFDLMHALNQHFSRPSCLISHPKSKNAKFKGEKRQSGTSANEDKSKTKDAKASS